MILLLLERLDPVVFLVAPEQLAGPPPAEKGLVDAVAQDAIEIQAVQNPWLRQNRRRDRSLGGARVLAATGSGGGGSLHPGVGVGVGVGGG